MLGGGGFLRIDRILQLTYRIFSTLAHRAGSFSGS